MPSADEIVVNKEFSFVEQKRAQLAFQQPEVHTKGKLPGLEQAALLFGSVINQELGPDGAHVKIMLDEATGDVLIFGIGPTKIGYTSTMVMREVQVPMVDPFTQQPVMDPFGQPALTVEQRPVIISEEYYWRSIAPDKFLMPVEFEGLDFDQATWLGWEFEKDYELAKREYGLDDRTAVSKAFNLPNGKSAAPVSLPIHVRFLYWAVLLTPLLMILGIAFSWRRWRNKGVGHILLVVLLYGGVALLWLYGVPQMFGHTIWSGIRIAWPELAYGLIAGAALGIGWSVIYTAMYLRARKTN